jgi:hypothetical protein
MDKREAGRRSHRTRKESFKIIVEKHADGYVAYSLGFRLKFVQFCGNLPSP